MTDTRPKTFGDWIVDLGHRNSIIRRRAAREIGNLREPRGAGPLAQLLVDPVPDVQEVALQALAKLGTSEATRLVADALVMPTREGWFRAFAAEALAFAPVPDALRALGATASDPDTPVRLAVIETLAAIPHADVAPPLLKALEDPDEWVRRAACEGLGKLRLAEAVHPLIDRLRDSSACVRGLACEALGRIGDAAASPALVGHLDDDPTASYWAAWALGEIADATGSDALVGAMQARRLWIVKGAFRFFVRRGDPGAVGALVATLFDCGSGDEADLALASGQADLVEAAHQWADKTGYAELKTPPSAPRWGIAKGREAAQQGVEADEAR